MKNPLIKSVLIVFFFWYIVLYLMSDAPVIDMPAALLQTIAWVTFSAGIGIFFTLARGIFHRGQRDQRLLGRKLRGASTTLGNPPIPGLAPSRPSGKSLADHWNEFGWTPRGEVPPEFWAQFPWWPAYRAKYPAYAAAFAGCAQVMFGMPALPASPRPGGHGGVSLIRHSVSVLHTLMEMAPEWKFSGNKNKKGQLKSDGALYDLTKTHHAFHFRSIAEADFDPILPLAAFAHDIGKVRCYEPQNWKGEDRSIIRRKKRQVGWDGPVDVVREVKPLHGLEGARLLRRMSEIHNLPMKERDALLVCVAYYHDIDDMPRARWIDDRTRSLVHLLYEADVATGVQEGDKDALSHNVDVGMSMTQEPPQTDQVAGAPGAESKTKASEIVHVVPSKRLNPTFPPLPDDGIQFESPGAETPSPPLLDDSSAIAMVRSLLLRPGMTNSPRAKGAAYKYGEWIFMQETTLRTHLAEVFQKGELARTALLNEPDPFTMQLLAELHSNGWLFNFHNGFEYSEKRALWTIDFEKNDGKKGYSKFVVVASLKAFPELANLADSTPQRVVECSYGATAALNKKAGPKSPPQADAPPLSTTSQETAAGGLPWDDSPAEAPAGEDVSIESSEGQAPGPSLLDQALDASLGLELEPLSHSGLKRLSKTPSIPYIEVDGRKLYKETIVSEYLDTRKEVRPPNSGVKGTRVNGEVFFYLDPDHKDAL